ncbi:prolipoprotein diacylglyceryl transferase [Alkaliphilus metalliredigens QYMF]|uniref:Phosphatidylglycerol--prolipoprotein diacylglyceryl transferase n=1 Tax=Alkaliphilus metalliredigens (strain QYMF) TaxID=293826 RepID=A6TT74_ALKMQ|nr:prolipoprotein diacylglyceryl transferase [Alkaliphilus metalliredigens]ABR49392.1 prolipoprotein diacylglyceryl transferase [Alkaliphilus metalliredigens QYMF]
MVQLFSIGGFNIHLFGITIAIGMIAGMSVMLREGKRKGLNQDKIMDLGLYTIIAGVIGARLNYILAFNFSYYLEHPRAIFMLQEGGLSIQGALIGGALFAFWYMKKHKIPMWQTADAFAPAIILGQAIGRVGCDVFGIPMSRAWFWGVEVGAQLLHPAQIYEAILNYILFLVLWNKRKSIKYDGQIFMMYLIGFSINRFVIEFFRTNPMVAGPISIAHVYSVLIIMATLVVMNWLKKKQQKTQSTVENPTVHDGKIEWTANFIIGAAMIVSVMFYYWIHSL